LFNGGDELFDHDLNIELLEALGLNVPAQTEFQIKADSSGFIVFDDFLGKNVVESSSTSGTISLYENDEAAEGSYNIKWSNPTQYDQVGFDLRPNRDLSDLVKHDFSLDFWIKGNLDASKLDIRFVDSKTGIGDDHPWRTRVVIDENMVTWDGNWQKISIPLKDFEEHGSWDDNTWFEPVGEFDWKDVDRLDIVSEYNLQHPIDFGFDQIEIKGNDFSNQEDLFSGKIKVYPNPSQKTVIVNNAVGPISWNLLNLTGDILKSGQNDEDFNLDLSPFPQGIYFLNCLKGGETFYNQRIVKK